MVENEIYFYDNGFLKWNINKNTSYIVENKTFTGKICLLSLRNKRKSMGERRSQRKRVRTQLKVSIHKTIGQSLLNVSLEENLCILGVQ